MKKAYLGLVLFIAVFCLPAQSQSGYLVTRGLLNITPSDTLTKIAIGGKGYWGIGVNSGWTEWSRGPVYAIKSDSSLMGWNGWTGLPANVPAGNNFINISAGMGHLLALKADSTLYNWGGSGWNLNNVPTGTFKSIAAGIYHNLAIRTSGAMVAWGLNYNHAFDIPLWNNYSSADINGYCYEYPNGEEPGWTSYYNSYSIGLKAGHSIVSWGYNIGTVPSGNNYTAVSAGYTHALALKSDGTVVAWGYNDYGQCDVPPYNDYIAVAAGAFHSLAIRADGSIVGWGDNTFGQLDFPAGNQYFAIAAANFISAALATAPVSNNDQANTLETACITAFPNPFSLSGNLTFTAKLRDNETGKLYIHNQKGQKVKSLPVDGRHPEIKWDGKNSRGQLCAPGIYFYQLRTNLHRQTGKLLILR